MYIKSSKNLIAAVAIVKTPIGKNGFGFSRVGGSIDVFTRVEKLIDAGFNRTDFAPGVSVTIEYEAVGGGKFRTERITAIGNKLAPKYFKSTIVDRANGFVITKVIETGREMSPIFRISAENGDLVSTEYSLGKARDKIGKVIEVPVALNAGRKTNVPQLNKGPSGQSGNQSKGKMAA